MAKTEQVTVTLKDLHQRIDKFLAGQFPTRSRAYFQYLIEEDCVMINGLPVKKQQKVTEGDQVQVEFQDTPLLDVAPEEIPLDILFEDDEILVVNKPAGMVVHPAPGAPNQTFANALMYHCKQLDKKDFDDLRPGIVHRLDRDTSGVLIAAKNRNSHKHLALQFAERSTAKRYLVICCGVPKEGLYSAPIKRHPVRRKEMTVSEGGKEAVTEFTVLARRGGFSLVEAKLITGRTHQIRVHLKSMNCPVLGDTTYGSTSLNLKYKAERQLLHAHSLELTHPNLHEKMRFEAPVPTDMKNFIELIQQA